MFLQLLNKYGNFKTFTSKQTVK